MTLSEFQTVLAAELGLKCDVAAHAEQTLANFWFNEGVREVLRRTKCHQEHKVIDLAASAVAGDYVLGPIVGPAIAILELYIGGTDPKYLQKRDADDILRLRRQSIAVDYPMYYHFAGEELLMFAPVPSATPALQALYVPLPTKMTTGGHDPSDNTYGGIPVEYHEAILLWACFKGARYDGSSAPHSPKEYHDLFREEIAEVRRDLRTRGGRNLTPLKVGYPGFASSPRSNSQYPTR